MHAYSPEQVELVDGVATDSAVGPDIDTEDLRILLKEILWTQWMTVPSMQGEGRSWDLSGANFEVSSLSPLENQSFSRNSQSSSTGKIFHSYICTFVHLYICIFVYIHADD